MAQVSLDDVTKVYPDGTPAVRGLDLRVDDGEFMVFVGPSGCGKTTALRMVAGLEDISAGEVRIGDRVVNRVPSKAGGACPATVSRWTLNITVFAAPRPGPRRSSRLGWSARKRGSRAAAERLGFTYEGTFRQAQVVKGRNRDTAWFAIVDADWPRIRDGFQTWLAADNFDGDGRQRAGLRVGA